jgi:hypothetical protein
VIKGVTPKIKLLQKDVDTNSPMKEGEMKPAKIVKLTMKRQSSAVRSSSKIKIKAAEKQPEKKEELYGLDIDFLEDLGLGDMLSDLQKEEEEERKLKKQQKR